MNELTPFRESLDHIRRYTDFEPETGIILGTGLGELVDLVEEVASFDYSDIPHFPLSTVETHRGRLILGLLNGKKVVVMQGRFHHYEGYNMYQVTYPVRVMKFLGIKNLLVSNISGGINPKYQLGDLVVIEDHINLHHENPLTGMNLDDLGPRWPDMFEPYKQDWIKLVLEFGKRQGYTMHEGVYASVPGPNLETRAEYRYLSRIGADAVGMSTVPEIIVAKHMGLNCFALSAITDLCYEPELKPANIDELLATAAEAQPKMTAVFEYLVSKI